jgi:tetratricopeptide (TPR) repeat protein
VSGDSELEQGRAAYAQRRWSAAYEALSAADAGDTLAAEDLESLAVAAYMLGRVEEYLATIERAHNAYLAAGESHPAVRSAVHLGVTVAMLGDVAKAGGWFARAQRLADRRPGDCPERGYVLLPLACATKRPATTRSSRKVPARQPRSASASETATCSRSARTSRASP